MTAEIIERCSEINATFEDVTQSFRNNYLFQRHTLTFRYNGVVYIALRYRLRNLYEENGFYRRHLKINCLCLNLVKTYVVR